MKAFEKNFDNWSRTDLKNFLDEQSDRYNTRAFICDDPISIPHQFTRKEDIEISAFLTATISWGNRKSIVANANKMMLLMDQDPFQFVMNHDLADLKRLEKFVHRTFNAVDLIQFIQSLKHFYVHAGGMESVFTQGMIGHTNTAAAISGFKEKFFEGFRSSRSDKHVSDPSRGSAAKRINMFLRWMVRHDTRGVDFGLWRNIPMSSLSIPLDIHTGNIARKLGLLHRKQNDRKAVEELDAQLRSFDSIDPVKYDFALFGLGAMKDF